jgi:hypothetical protein
MGLGFAPEEPNMATGDAQYGIRQFSARSSNQKQPKA